MAEKNQPEQRSAKLNRGNYNEKFNDYKNNESDNNNINNNIHFSNLQSLNFLIVVIAVVLTTGFLIVCTLVFLLFQDYSKKNHSTITPTNNQKEYTTTSNDLIATEILNNIFTIDERWKLIKSLKQKDKQLQQEDLNQLQNFANNRPFCREIYDSVISIELNNTWSNKERDAIGQFYIFIEQIDESYKILAKSMYYTENLNSDSVKYKIDSIVQIIDTKSIAASLIGEIMIEKLNAKPDINISKMLASQDNIRVICDPKLKNSLTRIIEDKFLNPDHSQNP